MDIIAYEMLILLLLLPPLLLLLLPLVLRMPSTHRHPYEHGRL